jgi:hypothetical protein
MREVRLEMLMVNLWVVEGGGAECREREMCLVRDDV